MRREYQRASVVSLLRAGPDVHKLVVAKSACVLRAQRVAFRRANRYNAIRKNRICGQTICQAQPALWPHNVRLQGGISMLIGLIVFLGVGILFFVLGTVLWKKQRMDLVNEWHTRNVKPEDVPAYTRLIGLSLLAIGAVVAVGLEEAHLASGAVLLEEVAHHTHLHSFMILVGAIDVEELEAYDLRRLGGTECRDMSGDIFVDSVFAPAIGVKRPQRSEEGRVVTIDESAFAGTIGGCRRSIYERYACGAAEGVELQCELEVVLHDAVDISLGGGRYGTEVEHRLDFRLMLSNKALQLIWKYQLQGSAFCYVFPFVAAAECVAAHDVAIAPLLHFGQQVGANEACGTGDDIHSLFFCCSHISGTVDGNAANRSREG